MKGRVASPEFKTGVAIAPPRAPVKGWRSCLRIMGLVKMGRARERNKLMRSVAFMLDD